METEWRKIADDIKEWVKEAGEKLVESTDRPLTYKQKTSDIDYATEMDEWADEFFKAKITESYPNHAILTEETGEIEGSSDYKWIIDPIDGTVNFFHGFPMYCISIAVQYKDKNVIGIVYAPKLGELYEAISGEGAYLNGKQLRVSQINELSKSVLATGFPYDKAVDPDNNVNNFNKVITKIGGIRRTGSAAIDLAQVAAGRFEGYWELKLNPWDIEAGLLLVEEAGGKVLKQKMNKGYFVMVGNNEVFDQLKDLLEIKY